MFRKTKILFVIAFFISFCGNLFASEAVVDLKKEVYINASQFSLGDIASINGSDTELVTRLKNLFLGELSCLEKSRRNITHAEIVMKLGQIGIDTKDVKFEGASVVSVYPKLQTVNSADIFKAVKTFIFDNMPWDREDVIIENTGRDSKVVLKQGDVTVEIAPKSRNQYIGPVRYTAIISVDGLVQKSVDVSINISVFKKVLVASRKIKRGEMLNPSNLVMVRRQLSANAKDAIDDPKEALGMVAARNIPAQKVIKKKYLTPPLIVKNREAVKLIFQMGKLSIQTLGVARESGSLGDYIRVQNVDSKKVIYGRVVGVRQVSVSEMGG